MSEKSINPIVAIKENVKSIYKVKTKSINTRWKKFKAKSGVSGYFSDAEFIVYRGVLINLSLLALLAFMKYKPFDFTIITLLGGGALAFLFYEFLDYLGLDDKFNPERQRRKQL